MTPNPPGHAIQGGCGVAFSENILHVSTIRETVICPVCRLSQFERGSGTCRCCHHPLGLSYIEVFLPIRLDLFDAECLTAIKVEIGALIRRLRSRRGITQAAPASVTRLHRTYVSRAERGQVLPAIDALIRIASALGVDKVLLRVRNSAT